MANSYSPAGNSAITYPPSSPVVVSRISPVARFFAATLASGTTAPSGSVTTPRLDPRKDCATATEAAREKIPARTPSARIDVRLSLVTLVNFVFIILPSRLVRFLLSIHRRTFPRNKNLCGRTDVELSPVIPLVNGDPHVAS